MTSDEQELPHGTGLVPKAKRKRDWTVLRDTVARFQDDPFWRLAILTFEFGAVVAALWALFLTISQTEMTRQGLQDQRLVSAWSLLSQDGIGAGKRYALETLTSIERRVSGIVVTCPQGASECTPRPDLRGLTLTGPYSQAISGTPYIGGSEGSSIQIDYSNFAQADLEGASFTYVHFGHTQMNGVSLDRVKFSYSTLLDVDMSRSFGGASFVNSRFVNVSLARTNLASWQFTGENTFTNVEISGARLCAPVNTAAYINERSRQEFAKHDIDRCVAGLSALIADAWFLTSSPPLEIERFPRSMRIGNVCNQNRDGTLDCSGPTTVGDYLDAN